MIKRVVLPMFVCVLAACVAFAAQQTITLKSGQKITGDVTRTDTGYKVMIGGMSREFSDEQVTSVVSAEDSLKEYKARLAKIDPNSADDHVALARWAYDNGKSDIAMKELQAALKINPDHERAKLLMRVLQGKGKAAVGPETRKAEPTPEATSKPADKDLVSDEDIARIRMYELSEKDQPQVEYKNQVLERFLKSAAGNTDFKNDKDFEKKFRTWPKGRQITYIKDNGGDTPAILDDIIIKSDPKIIKDFQSNIWPSVAANCGQIKCHGGPGGKGGLIFFRASGERAIYTNFLIVNLWEKDDGSKIIDRSDIDNSLLLQYGLPTSQAKTTHPVKLGTTLFTNANSAQYKRFHSWLDRLTSSGTRQPDYRTKYQPPGGHKLTPGGKPASLPADTTSQPAGEKNEFD